MERGTTAELVGKQVWGTVAGSPKGLTSWRSESAADRQGGSSPHMLREMVQEFSSNPRPELCPLDPGSCRCSSLSFSSRDGRFLELCLVALARGLQRQPKLRYWPMGAQGRPQSLPGVDFWPKVSPSTLVDAASCHPSLNLKFLVCAMRN